MSASFFICEDCKIDVYGGCVPPAASFLERKLGKELCLKKAHIIGS